jgi:nicotinamidase-related amidase
MNTLPVPAFYNPKTVGDVWRVAYQERAGQAEAWAKKHRITPASNDTFRIYLLLVDVQNTFCIPGFELFVAGAKGTGAVDDNRRLCEFIYQNLHVLTRICPTMDTHQVAQIFHSIFLINDKGVHPAPYTLISTQDIENGTWRFNTDLAPSLNIDIEYGQKFLEHYTKKLKQGGKYDLTIWPFHAMLGGIGHALVSAVEEAIFFHSIARYSQPDFQVKGRHPLTENYSVLSPEVTTGPGGQVVAPKNEKFLRLLINADAVIIAGQAKSHCVAWTIDDLLGEILIMDEKIARKIYLLEDCSSPVVIPGVIDYTQQADEAFKRFELSGMHLVRSTEPISSWPGINIE